MAKKVQRIKLRMRGNPLKLDATILEMSADGKEIKVRFDGPLPDMTLYVWSQSLLIDRKLGPDESPAQYQESECRLWEVA